MSLSRKKVFFDDYVFNVWENVYEPAEDSLLFAENLKVQEGENVIDMGTGCGILGIIAAKKARRVLAVDINPGAVRCAIQNAKLNSLASKMLFIQGDLFTPIVKKKAFDSILFNSPYLPSSLTKHGSWLERAWAGGVVGRQVIDRFISEVPKHLNRKGRAFLLQSTLSSVDKTLQEFENRGLNARVVAKRALPFFETISLVKAVFHS